MMSRRQLVLPLFLFLGNIAGSITRLLAFTTTLSPVLRPKSCRQHLPNVWNCQHSTDLLKCGSLAVAKGEESVKVRNLLSDLPTPTLLIELSLAESALNNTSMTLDDYLRSCETNDETATIDGSVFVHTKIMDTSVRDRINQERGSGKSPVIGRVDALSQDHVPGGAFLGIGLSNHHVGGYYWARGMGIGASLEAHGVSFRNAADAHDLGGELYWTKREEDSTIQDGSGVLRGATTDESSNSNDGKRSEWADFLVRGDTVQLIPYNATTVLRESAFERILGVRRMGRPLGADPIVEQIWKRGSSEKEGDNSNRDVWIPL